MKALTVFVNEKLNDFFAEELYEVFSSTMDYLYNEGIMEYQENYLRDYRSGKLNMDYHYFIKVALQEFGSTLPDGCSKLLQRYLANKLSKDRAMEVEDLILQNIDNFA